MTFFSSLHMIAQCMALKKNWEEIWESFKRKCIQCLVIHEEIVPYF
jgi:hypothetical protein